MFAYLHAYTYFGVLYIRNNQNPTCHHFKHILHSVIERSQLKKSKVAKIHPFETFMISLLCLLFFTFASLIYVNYTAELLLSIVD